MGVFVSSVVERSGTAEAEVQDVHWPVEVIIPNMELHWRQLNEG